MIAVIFEAIPKEGQQDAYFKIASDLKPLLENIPGFISIERFQSFNDPAKVLSLSFWKDEESIQQWRNVEMHRWAQSQGREHIFKDYHLRIAVVSRDYGMFQREQAPVDSRIFHETKV